MPRLTPPAPEPDRLAFYYCWDGRCDRGMYFDLRHPHGWTTERMEEALRAAGWEYLRQRSFTLSEPHGWRCPIHAHQHRADPSWKVET